jgi:chorismate dehydratase
MTIGSVPYLNARPLVTWFTDTEAGRATGVTVVEVVPSALAGMLERGEIDAALLSSIALFRQPGLVYAPGIAIAADGPVESVRVFSKGPLARVRTLALDTSSLTSVALLRILLRNLGVAPDLIPMAPDREAMLAQCDACLLIGDIGYQDPPSATITITDLGALWKEQTGLPFVYAAWIGEPQRLNATLCAYLTAAKAWGLAHLAELGAAEAERRGQTVERAVHYLVDIMRYDIGPREEAALRLFGQRASALGLLSRSEP